MHCKKMSLKLFFVAGLLLAFVIFIPPLASGQDYPNKPITMWCAYAAGATVDATTRALAAGAEKLLGVPVVVENKPGASGSICASLLATRKPDGYTLATMDSGVLSVNPLTLNVNYDPQKDFIPIIQWTNSIGGLCVLKESPLMTIEDAIAYIKAHPGATISSTGPYTIHTLAIELFAKSKGLKTKIIPFASGAPAITNWLGKHSDFLMGSGSHMPYVEQGTARLLMVLMTNKRDPDYPNIPTSRELGAEDMDPPGYVAIGPKGMPDAVVKKLEDTFKKVIESNDFQALLKQVKLPYVYKNRMQLVKDIPVQSEQYQRNVSLLGLTLKKE